MVHGCCIVGCKSRANGSSPGVSYHEIPVNTDIRNVWFANIRRKNFTPTDSTRVCSLHFEQSAYRDGVKIRKLKPNAAPTLFLTYPSYVQAEIRKKCKQRKAPPHRNRDSAVNGVSREVRLLPSKSKSCKRKLPAAEGSVQKEPDLLKGDIDIAINEIQFGNISSPRTFQKNCDLNPNTNIYFAESDSGSEFETEIERDPFEDVKSEAAEFLASDADDDSNPNRNNCYHNNISNQC